MKISTILDHLAIHSRSPARLNFGSKLKLEALTRFLTGRFALSISLLTTLTSVNCSASTAAIPAVPSELFGITKSTTVIDAFRPTPKFDRHDPSNIIRYDDRYWVFYTWNVADHKEVSVNFASSSDGYRWKDLGEAIGHGPQGSWDESGAIAPYCVRDQGKFYLFYTGFHGGDLATRELGCAIANHPTGPWIRYQGNPVLRQNPDLSAWDSGMLGDSNVIFREGKWWFYFKSRRDHETSRDTRIGVAIADEITGPYHKHPDNPLFAGHAFSAWPHRNGVAALCGAISPKIKWSPDGLRFVDAGEMSNQSTGLFTPNPDVDKSRLRGFDWGLDVYSNGGSRGLRHFDRGPRRIRKRVPREEAVESVLELNEQFALAKLSRMPRSSSDLWHIAKRDYPAANAVEWQMRLRGPTDGESPLWKNVRSADFILKIPSDSPIVLHWSKGSDNSPLDYQTHQTPLELGKLFSLESSGGRSSDGAMPYFNLAAPGGGLIFAVGWTGDWRASFESRGAGKVRLTAGLKRANFRLHSGEEVRLPSVLVMSYRGDWLEGQNQFRRLMLEEFTPKNHPPMKLMPVAASVHGLIGFNNTTESNLTALVKDLHGTKLPIDTFWLDAGWNTGGFPLGQGNPAPDRTRFPRGLAPVGVAARNAGFRFLAWFEPERAMRSSWMDQEHASWLLLPSVTPPQRRHQEKDGFRLLDLGNPEARQWATDRISKQIHTAGIGIYRQDCNLSPAAFWKTNELADRVGIREIRHITGLYKLIDELAQRNPALIIDNCASGGRRLDFEMMRRCVALWRSDSCWGTDSFPRNVQAMTHGLSLWLPLHGLGATGTDNIALRSGMGTCASFAINFRDPTHVEALRLHLKRYLKVRPLFTRDYYPLTPWSSDPEDLLAFQFNEPQSGEGLVQVFRGTASNDYSALLTLRGLDPAAHYTFTNWDDPLKQPVFNGADLMSDGLPVTVRRAGVALVFSYSLSFRPAGSHLTE